MELVLFALLGWLIGALINRAADDLPARRALLDTPRCAYCGTLRPVLNQLALRAPCPNCTAPITWRVPLVAIASALAFAFLWTRYGATVQLVLSAFYTAVFLLVLVTDFEHRLILNIVILPATLFAALASPLSQLGWQRSLLGGMVAYVFVFAIYMAAPIFSRLRGHTIAVPFGFGDVKLAGFMGIVTGFPAVVYALVFAILLGGVGVILFLAYHLIVHRRLALSAAIPYGPYFCVAGWGVMIFQI